MKDTIIKGTGDSRYLKSAIPENITHAQLVQMLRNGTFPFDLNGINEAGIEQLGTPLNTATLLSDETAEEIGIEKDNPTVDDALSKVRKHATEEVGDIKISTRTDVGDKYLLANGETAAISDYPALGFLPNRKGFSNWKAQSNNENDSFIDYLYDEASGYHIFIYYSGSTLNITYATDLHSENWETKTILEGANGYYPRLEATKIKKLNGYFVVNSGRQDADGYNYGCIVYSNDITANWTVKDLWQMDSATAASTYKDYTGVCAVEYLDGSFYAVGTRGYSSPGTPAYAMIAGGDTLESSWWSVDRGGMQNFYATGYYIHGPSAIFKMDNYYCIGWASSRQGYKSGSVSLLFAETLGTNADWKSAQIAHGTSTSGENVAFYGTFKHGEYTYVLCQLWSYYYLAYGKTPADFSSSGNRITLSKVGQFLGVDDDGFYINYKSSNDAKGQVIKYTFTKYNAVTETDAGTRVIPQRYPKAIPDGGSILLLGTGAEKRTLIKNEPSVVLPTITVEDAYAYIRAKE